MEMVGRGLSLHPTVRCFLALQLRELGNLSLEQRVCTTVAWQRPSGQLRGAPGLRLQASYPQDLGDSTSGLGH
jgi:hypothetical protein